ncbi:MAG: nuclear transport factor 2 family protein [Gemmatimonadaceae bacterium]
MSYRIASPLLVLLLGCATAPANRPAVDLPGAEAAIRSLEDQERLAVLSRDAQALQGLWSERFMVNAPINQVAPNRGIVLQLLQQGLIHYSSFERRIEQIRFDGDFAIVMGGETVQPAGNAPLAGQTVQRRFTHMWKHEQGEWRLIARHANNVNPSP